jgi:hypothetical protein
MTVERATGRAGHLSRAVLVVWLESAVQVGPHTTRSEFLGDSRLSEVRIASEVDTFTFVVAAFFQRERLAGLVLTAKSPSAVHESRDPWANWDEASAKEEEMNDAWLEAQGLGKDTVREWGRIRSVRDSRTADPTRC